MVLHENKAHAVATVFINHIVMILMLIFCYRTHGTSARLSCLVSRALPPRLWEVSAVLVPDGGVRTEKDFIVVCLNCDDLQQKKDLYSRCVITTPTMCDFIKDG